MTSFSYNARVVSRICLQTNAFPSYKVTTAKRSITTYAGGKYSSLLFKHRVTNSSCRQPNFNIICQRQMSNKNFIQRFIDDIITDKKKSKEMEERIAKFKQDSQKLEESDALRQARKKFETVEGEAIKGSAPMKDTLYSKVSELSEEAQKQEYIKKTIDITSIAATKTADILSRTGQTISGAFGADGMKAAKEDADESNLPRDNIYRPPDKLRKRSDRLTRPPYVRNIDEDGGYSYTQMVLYKDSKDAQFEESWQKFKYNKDNRQFRVKVGDKLCSMFTMKTELSKALTEVCKIDQHFDQETFKRICDREIIPNVLEASMRGDLDILNDWCYEASYKTLAKPIEKAKKSGCYFDSKVLDVSNSEILAGKCLTQGPVLTIYFTTQQTKVVRNIQGDVIEGDPSKVLNVQHEWDLGREVNELDPVAAWRLLGIHQKLSSTQQWI